MKLSLCIFCVFLIITSCKKENRIEKDVEYLMGREMAFPVGYKTMPLEEKKNTEINLNNPIKIISYIDRFSCNSCLLETVQYWKEEMASIDSTVPYIIILRGLYTDSLNDMFRGCKTSVILYESDIFQSENDLENVLAKNKTFLVGHNNKILTIGEPYDNAELKKLYRKAIAKEKELN